MNDTPIAKAISVAGSASNLARELGVTPGLVSQWKSGRRPVAAQHCLRIECVTKGRVSRHDLRPDVFGPAKRRPASPNAPQEAA